MQYLENFVRTKLKKNCFEFYKQPLENRFWKNYQEKIYDHNYIFLKQSIFALLVCSSHEEPIEGSNLDCLYLKSYFEF